MSKLNTSSRVAAWVLFGAGVNQASGLTVDTELLLLVDVSGSVDSREYDLMIQGYADAFRSSEVVSAIESGHYKSIAASVMFWSGRDEQSVGVDWMVIDSAESATSFSDAILQTQRPFSGMTAIGSALNAGASFFGDETGGVANGFESLVQVIDISGDGTDNNTPPDGVDRAQNVRASRDAALAAGVDMINGLPIGNAGGALENYYQDNVIGGEAAGVEAFTQASADFSFVEDSLGLKLQREVEAAGAESMEIVAAIPEPSSAVLLGVGGSFLLLLRRRP
ncbi:DUF1194 domain-containing protein [Haloferula sp.]|uniref:DUF1194 domain-containing protein n=1 Tax=Haloferula sp. TaxID=2497595 RepID=UPI00329F0146